jgi:hypothetical protein
MRGGDGSVGFADCTDGRFIGADEHHVGTRHPRMLAPCSTSSVGLERRANVRPGHETDDSEGDAHQTDEEHYERTH